MRRAGSRRTAAIAAVVAVVAVVAGCGAPLNPPAPVTSTASEPTPPTDMYTAELAPYYTQQVHWQPCADDDRFQCATMTAPLDWQDPAADSIELALARLPATGEKVGSLVMNPGGPGASGIDTLLGSAAYGGGVSEHYDSVSFDPRGVYRSTPLTCFPDDAAYDEYLYGSPQQTEPYPRSDEPGFLKEYRAQTEDFVAGCKRYSGPILAHLDTWSVAHDLDLIRAVLGDAKLNYLGYSYGTYIGAYYLSLFPDKAGRIVLDGMVDPLADPFDADLLSAVSFDETIAAWGDWCVQQGATACPFGGDADAVIAWVQRLLDRVDENPPVAVDGRKLWASNLITGILLTMYSEDFWPALSQMLADVDAGNADYAFALADAYNNRNPDGTYAGNAFQVIAPVRCEDFDNLPSMKEIEKQADALSRAAPFWGPWFSYSAAFCHWWPVKYDQSHDVDFSAPGTPDVVVIATSGDPATPYEQAVSYAASIPNGHLVTFDGEQHTVYNQGVPCVDDLVNAYFVDGALPPDGATC